MPEHSPWTAPSIPSWVNHQLESRMRENRLSGSEGGGTGQPVLPTPIVCIPDLFNLLRADSGLTMFN